MQETWRWFGPKDTVSLKQIVQAGAKGIVSALHEVPIGEVWSIAAIRDHKALIENHGLHWAVVESVPVHEDIKTRSGNCQQYIENYQQTVRNLGACGIPVLCYNFMPVVDWMRTDLKYTQADSSHVLRFDMTDFAAYDLYVLERPGAENDYDDGLREKARQRFEAFTKEDIAQLDNNVVAGLPGGTASTYTRASILDAIARYADIGEAGLKQNLASFIRDIAPVAESVGVRMCIHPDDPPFPLLGLPRVVSTAEHARELLAASESISNGLTLCAGSFGARGDNDLIAMMKEFGPRVHFVHLRNVKREEDGSFYESDHLAGDNDMVGLINTILDEEDRRQQSGRTDSIPMRPDHGSLMADEEEAEGVNPGYSYGGRMKALAELRGVTHALENIRSQTR